MRYDAEGRCTLFPDEYDALVRDAMRWRSERGKPPATPEGTALGARATGSESIPDTDEAWESGALGRSAQHAVPIAADVEWTWLRNRVKLPMTEDRIRDIENAPTTYWLNDALVAADMLDMIAEVKRLRLALANSEGRL